MSQKQKDLNICLMLLGAWSQRYHANIRLEVEELADLDDDDSEED